MVATTGTLTDWSRAANTLFAAGCEPQSFVLLASLAAPLMPLWRRKDAGAVVSIFGGKRTGKSTAIAAAESVWGQPGSCSHCAPPLPWVSESFINRDPYLLRQAFEDEIQRSKTHAPLIISASGMSLFGAISRPNEPFRLGIEFPLAVPPGLIAARDRNQTEYDLQTNFGHAGNALMEYLADAKNQHSARRLMRSYLSGLEVSTTGDAPEKTWKADAHDYARRIIATARVAGDIAVRLKLLEMDPERIAKWALGQIGETT